MKEEVRKEVLKLLEAGLIYPISDSSWVSPVQVVLKKGGMTVIKNDKDELIPTRTVTGWRMCIDYRKLNEATKKDHYPHPFMDQMQTCKAIFLLFLRWIFGLQSNCSRSSGPRKDSFYMPFWCICLSLHAFWFM